MSKRDAKLLVADMIEASHKIIRYTAKMDFASFSADPKTVDATIRNFEVIGEAANRLPDSFKYKHTHIQWSRLSGFRNRLIHEYFGVDLEILWHITQNDLVTLIKELAQLSEETK